MKPGIDEQEVSTHENQQDKPDKDHGAGGLSQGTVPNPQAQGVEWSRNTVVVTGAK